LQLTINDLVNRADSPAPRIVLAARPKAWRVLQRATVCALIIVVSLSLSAVPGTATADTAVTSDQPAAPVPASVPVIREIAFEGNDVTKPRVMQRELLIQVGDPVDSPRIERSRQAIEDLALFRRVDVRQEAVDGGVRVVFAVHEKWYLLPVPRFGYDSDKRLSYGGQVAWNNFRGLNETLRLNWVRGDAAQSGRGQEQILSAAYNAPFVADSRWTMDLSGSHRVSPVESPTVYNETFDAAQLLFSRGLSVGPASQGWQAGGGIFWQNEDRSGEGAPPPYGHATAGVGILSYRDLRYQVYSEQGMVWFARGELAGRHLASDYGYEQLTSGIRRYYAIGTDPYQSLNLLADVGMHLDGPPGVDTFSLGGRSGLRAYPPNQEQGNAYYRVAAEYLHPIYWNSLRGLAVFEAGKAFDDVTHPNFNSIDTSLGLGLRLRVIWLVNFEIEAGVAIPLNHPSKPRAFGGRL
jgi:hypothetical protein